VNETLGFISQRVELQIADSYYAQEFLVSDLFLVRSAAEAAPINPDAFFHRAFAHEKRQGEATRSISIGQLNVLLRLHLQPINVLV
jgi:hypothetical protein